MGARCLYRRGLVMVMFAIMALMASMATWIVMHTDREAAGLPEWWIDVTLPSPNFSSFVVSRRDPDLDDGWVLGAVMLAWARGGGLGEDVPTQPPPPTKVHGKGRRAGMGEGTRDGWGRKETRQTTTGRLVAPWAVLGGFQSSRSAVDDGLTKSETTHRKIQGES